MQIETCTPLEAAGAPERQKDSFGAGDPSSLSRFAEILRTSCESATAVELVLRGLVLKSRHLFEWMARVLNEQAAVRLPNHSSGAQSMQLQSPAASKLLP